MSNILTGLEMVLNAETYAYNNYTEHNAPEWRGAVVKIHTHGTEAIVEEGGVILATNTLSRMGVKKVCGSMSYLLDIRVFIWTHVSVAVCASRYVGESL